MGTNLKCLTAFVTYTLVRSMPASTECGIEQLSGGPDERMPGAVLQVPRLLADEHDFALAGTLPEHRLGGRYPEVATTTTPALPPEALGASARRDEVGGRSGGRGCTNAELGSYRSH